MICTKCKQEVVQGAVFCPWCGKKLQMQKKSRTKSRGNGTGTAFKRGNTWTAQVVVDYQKLPPFDINNPDNAKPRKKITRSKGGFKTRDAALQYCPILKAGPQKPIQAPTLDHYWEAYRNSSFAALSNSKQTAYRSAWKKLTPLHKTHIDQLTVADLQKAVADACTTHYTVRDAKTVLTALFRIAAAEGYVNKDIPSFIQIPKLEETERTPFSDTEQAALWKLYESGDLRAAPILLMIYTGMMPAECRALTVDNFDMDARLITGVGMKTKVRKASPIVLADFILPVAETLVANARKNGALFLKDKKIWYANYYEALKAAGCRPLTPYSCRHTTATALAINENIAPQTVQKVMRWANTRMLDRYAHPETSDTLAAVNTMKTYR